MQPSLEAFRGVGPPCCQRFDRLQARRHTVFLLFPDTFYPIFEVDAQAPTQWFSNDAMCRGVRCLSNQHGSSWQNRWPPMELIEATYGYTQRLSCLSLPVSPKIEHSVLDAGLSALTDTSDPNLTWLPSGHARWTRPATHPLDASQQNRLNNATKDDHTKILNRLRVRSFPWMECDESRKRNCSRSGERNGIGRNPLTNSWPMRKKKQYALGDCTHDWSPRFGQNQATSSLIIPAQGFLASAVSHHDARTDHTRLVTV